MARMSYLKQKTVVRKDVHGQVLDLFKFVHELGTPTFFAFSALTERIVADNATCVRVCACACHVRVSCVSCVSCVHVCRVRVSATNGGGMDPYPQPLNPAKEESFEAELDQVTRHTEQGPRTALAHSFTRLFSLCFGCVSCVACVLCCVCVVCVVSCVSCVVLLFSHATEFARFRAEPRRANHRQADSASQQGLHPSHLQVQDRPPGGRLRYPQLTFVPSEGNQARPTHTPPVVCVVHRVSCVSCHVRCAVC
jgi:hypothetical protein